MVDDTVKSVEDHIASPKQYQKQLWRRKAYISQSSVCQWINAIAFDIRLMMSGCPTIST
jgi:hypothetical protein